MNIKAHQGKQMIFHIICAKCGIYGHFSIMANLQAWINIALVFECSEWIGLESHWFRWLFEDKICALNDGKPNTNLKWLGLCAIVNSLSYIIDPNMQCLIIEWSHPWPWFFRHSQIPIKVLMLVINLFGGVL